MRILCLGGGPASLYFSILMKRQDPSHEITVLERGQRDSTWGFGVVFSADTLRGFQKEFQAIIAAVIGGCLLTGGYGSAVGAMVGALIFGAVEMGIFYTGIDTDWFQVFLGVMLLIAVLVNNYVRRKATEAR